MTFVSRQVPPFRPSWGEKSEEFSEVVELVGKQQSKASQ